MAEQTINQHCSIAQSKQEKNRYQDVIPFDQNRVTLSSLPDDYINASFISGAYSDREFISCQAPLPHTFEDFWIMICEQEICLVVMLSNFIEKDVVKAHRYWNLEGPTNYHSVTVSLVDQRFVLSSIVERKFLVEFQERQYHVTHLHYTGWPDGGIPEDLSDIKTLLEMTELIRREAALSSQKKVGRVLVHCSAGIGRSGTFIALRQLFDYQHLGINISVKEVVDRMRSCRMGMVETKQQYNFIFRVLEYAYFRTHSSLRNGGGTLSLPHSDDLERSTSLEHSFY